MIRISVSDSRDFGMADMAELADSEGESQLFSR